MNLQLKYVTRPDGTRSVTIPEDTRSFVISFVRDNAKTSTDAIAALVQDGHQELGAALAGLSEPQARFKPSPDEWSVLELMDHIVTTKQIIVGLSGSLAEGHLPPGVGAEWEEESAQDGVTVVHFPTLAEAKTAGDAAHAALLDLVKKLDGADVDATFKHFLFGRFNAREWAVFQRVHDADHSPQINRIKATPGFPAA